MLDGEKVLITGATGKIAFPIARALAERNEVWGAARLRNPADRDKLTAAGVTPLVLDMADPDFADLPDDFGYVFHAAVDPGTDDWTRCVKTNAHNSGALLHHCRAAKGFVLLLDRLDLRLPGPAPAARDRSARRAAAAQLQLLARSPPSRCARGSPTTSTFR